MPRNAIKLATTPVPLPADRVFLRDYDAIEVDIFLRRAADGAAEFVLSVDCQAVIEGFATRDFTEDAHAWEDDCHACHAAGWLNDEGEAVCYRQDDLAMDAFERRIAAVPELRLFTNGEHTIENDHWTIAATRHSTRPSYPAPN